MAKGAKERKKREAQPRRRLLNQKRAKAVSEPIPEDLNLSFLNSLWSQMSYDQQLDQMLAHYHHLQTGNMKSALPALLALENISARWDLPGENSPPPEAVSVPFWVVDTLRVAMNLYRQTLQDTPAKSFGEILGLEGGQGKRSALSQSEAELREIRLACWIAHTSVVERISIAKAIEIVKSKAAIGTKSLWRIWSQHKDQAMRTAGAFTRATSRSHDRAAEDSAPTSPSRASSKRT